MTSQLADLQLFPLGIGEVLTGLAVALACGLVIALVYRATYRGTSYSGGYVGSLILLTLITALVIMVIGNNLARAFGLVGAMSIIRFRTAVKETHDIVFIFFALSTGLASGAGMYLIGITGAIAISAVAWVASRVNDAGPRRPEYLIELVTAGDPIPAEELEDVFDRYCSRHRLVNIKRLNEPEAALGEYSFYVVLRDRRKAPEFAAVLEQLSGVMRVHVLVEPA